LFRLNNPVLNGGLNWSFIDAGVSVAELGSIAYDHKTNTIIAGLQDNGIMAQNQSSTDWTGLLSGDGNFVGVAYTQPYTAGNSMRFFMGNNFYSFKKQSFNASNVPQGNSVQLTLKDDPNNATDFTGLDNTWIFRGNTDQTFDGFFYIPFAVNAVDDL